MKSLFALLVLPLTCYGVPSIAVTISVYQPFVQQLIGEHADVFSIIPTATNMHIYEPSPEQLQKIAQALVWFSTADPLEAHIRRAITTPHIVDLRQGLTLKEGSCAHCGTIDPHIWTDPTFMKQQITTIAHALKEHFPAHQAAIALQEAIIQHKLDQLIKEMDALLIPCKGKILVMAHDAYGYLCARYHIHPIALEREGKEPTLALVEQAIHAIHDQNIQILFTMPQYSSKAIEKLANLTHTSTMQVDPYTTEYCEAMKKTALVFSQAIQPSSSS